VGISRYSPGIISLMLDIGRAGGVHYRYLLGMNWEEIDEVDTSEPEIEYKEFAVGNQSDTYRGSLRAVKQPPLGNFYVGHKAIRLYELVREEYGLNNPTSFQSIKDLAWERLSISHWQVARLCDRLWRRGLLRKWAQGIWREGMRREGEVGKYYGVYYEIIK
jgi:hypothetical protein